ncbi:MAG TPA: glutamine-hydrolyzing GMP synthase, partial [Bacteroidales bacterium]|nr:glutamine-hydrolyzing GMP synthase [Bacteroidales bacterium]
MTETILILDFGSQYTQLIARRVRELNVYCEIHPYNHIPSLGPHIRGIIYSGSPASVRDPGSPRPEIDAMSLEMPLLGVCYGAQLLAQDHGGEVAPAHVREYGRARLSRVDQGTPLLKGLSPDTQVWMSHADTILRIPPGFRIIASSGDVEIAGFRVGERHVYGLQFHPEVY